MRIHTYGNFQVAQGEPTQIVPGKGICEKNAARTWLQPRVNKGMTTTLVSARKSLAKAKVGGRRVPLRETLSRNEFLSGGVHIQAQKKAEKKSSPGSVPWENQRGKYRGWAGAIS